MLILTIKTENPIAEIGLYKDELQLAYCTWEAHRQLAETLHQKIFNMFASQHRTIQEAEGIVIYKGPGSFTGLRIGGAVANALAASLQVSIVGTTGEQWIEDGISLIVAGRDQVIATLEYGSTPFTTTPRK